MDADGSRVAGIRWCGDRARVERRREQSHAGNWARELTRAEGLERQLKAAIDARDAARKTCDDLTDHCASQGRRIADLDRQLGESFEIKLLQSDEIARLRASGADAARGADITARLRAYSSFLKSIWDVCYAQRAACLDDVRDALGPAAMQALRDYALTRAGDDDADEAAAIAAAEAKSR